MKFEVVTLVLVAGVAAGGGGDPVVETSLGAVRGQQLLSRSGRAYSAFTRIPFARPPVGELRFKAPVRYEEKWTDVYDATRPNIPCAQDKSVFGFTETSEDCLYLDVYTPNTEGSLPVMLYIFYGSWYSGYPGPVDMAKYFMDEDVVIVSANYRLGSFGFLRLGDEDIPGNMGLEDSAMALEWIKREIKGFGGNPDLLTVFGISSGAANAHYLCTSPKTISLLKGCITQSGTGGASLSLRDGGLAATTGRGYALNMGCSSYAMVDCLQRQPVENVTTQYALLFLPVTQNKKANTMIPQWPPKDSHLPWITGTTQNEGLIFTGYLKNYNELAEGQVKQVLKKTDSVIDWWKGTLKLFVPGFDLDTYQKNDPTLSNNPIYKRFFKDKDFNDGLEQLVTEWDLLYPAFEQMSHYKGPKYFYSFNYTGGPTYWEYMSKKKFNITGVGHGDDAPYFIHDPSLFQPYPDGWPSEKDVAFSKALIKMWVNFARTQKPTPDDSDPNWGEFTFSNPLYMEMTNDALIVKKYDQLDELLTFWSKLLGHKNPMTRALQ